MALTTIQMKLEIEIDDQILEEYHDGDTTAGIQVGLEIQDAIASLRPREVVKHTTSIVWRKS